MDIEEPRFPKSLYIIQPLFSVYELNPVGANAQASVAVPEGLDLDAWIVPPPREITPQAEAENDEDIKEIKKKKSKKGKGKESTPTSSKKKKVRGDGEPVVLTPMESDNETPEEKAQREKVPQHFR